MKLCVNVNENRPESPFWLKSPLLSSNSTPSDVWLPALRPETKSGLLIQEEVLDLTVGVAQERRQLEAHVAARESMLPRHVEVVRRRRRDRGASSS